MDKSEDSELFSLEQQAADYVGLHSQLNRSATDLQNEIRFSRKLRMFSAKNRAQSKEKTEESKSARRDSEENRTRSEILRRQSSEAAAIAEKRINGLFGKYIIVTCAWCKTRINLISITEPQNLEESHGICEACYEKMQDQIFRIS